MSQFLAEVIKKFLHDWHINVSVSGKESDEVHSVHFCQPECIHIKGSIGEREREKKEREKIERKKERKKKSQNF